MKRHGNFNLLLMLVLLVAVGQMAQTIYIPAIADMARELQVREGAVQSVMATYLLTYGVSQLFYGPLSDRIGRRPVILAGMSIFLVATTIAMTTSSLTLLIIASALQGMGTGVGGVMARTLPRDLYEGTQLRHANSLLNMSILVSPLLAPLIGGMLDTLWGWRVCYAFLLVLCAVVTFSMARWMPETRPKEAPRTRLITSYKTLLGNGSFNCYLLMLIGGLAGVAVFEACSGVLLGAVLGLSSMAVSILFILPIPAAFFGSWFAGRPNKRFPTLMWQSVICCLAGGLMMWIPGIFGIMNVWTLLIPAALFFFGAGMLFPLATSGAMEPFPFLAGTAGALVGGLQNIGSGVLAWFSAMLPQTGQGSLGLLMTLMGLLILLCWLPLASRFSRHQQTI
ncbi:MAG: multidrug efflux MFS transporter EmrD [Yokenella regensburgei]|jgi:DHA1 family 2-module integral membrane pump EmrD-like MFS transporter|uniref:DHA1 family 2-module integral membrane pump EmrD-like MFS transporter n=1 Tax=Yokenella regensburgei TaxID=158877 RepID=A0AB38FY30_9ENTR|nr:multidrug efflux MFS transporter EmrD [Yokenella regensburgei]EHM50137.1 multidrug resistance protein D [Yokenella regensburgei ATCC 43003]KAF1367671.1 DHA1 family 2-module integral membrane pump EmrD-like MFS transporter [Yokenella regensburgei]KFD24448.1 multidrug resistance protein D [Yokenella regensburgei ATCC 49455]MDQ4429820.1 multidrug efflux MFS transporter EmrD [Yokenella regensburgei]MDR2217715.1 multidrug efflux MFS transporter EmrD [Yokenella regensburgei]